MCEPYPGGQLVKAKTLLRQWNHSSLVLLGFCLATLFCLFESHAPLDDRALADGSSAIRNTSGMTALVSRRRLQRALGMENGRATWLDAVEPIVERLQETKAKEEEILLSVEANHSSVGHSRTSYRSSSGDDTLHEWKRLRNAGQNLLISKKVQLPPPSPPPPPPPPPANAQEQISAGCPVEKFDSKSHKYVCVNVKRAEEGWAGQLPQPSIPPSGVETSQFKTAVCISGQFRHLGETYSSFRDSFYPAFGPPGTVDTFMFINLDDGDSRKKFAGGANHSMKELEPIARALNVVELETYSMGQFNAIKPKVGKCFESPEDKHNRARHFSWHAPQFWNVHRCFELIKKHEVKTNFRYRWAVRLRPDGARGDWTTMAESIRSDVLPNSGITPRVWMGWGAVADAFAIMTRPAVESYGTVWSEFFDSTCMSLPQEAKRRRRFCVDVIVPPIIYNGTECLIAMHLRRSGVQLSMRGEFRTGLWGRRGAPGSQSSIRKKNSRPH